MAERKAKTAEKASPVEKRGCPKCAAEVRIVHFTGYGPRGFFWVCEKECGYTQRTR